ncbi:MAG: acetyl-CoA C-acetyltransferase [Pseudomonadota bacterium]
MARKTMRPVAIVGGIRTPFCRSNTAYADLSNLDMMSTSLQGLSDRFGLKGQMIDEVVGGAVINHSKDWNLAREAVQSTDLSPLTPATSIQQACGTSLQAAFIGAAKIATGQIESAIATGSDTTSDAPIVFGRKFAQRLVALGRARDMKSRLGAFKGFGLKELTPQPPSVAEPRTLLSMGQHCELMAQEWEIERSAQDELAVQSHLNAAAAYRSGFFDDLLVPCAGIVRDNNMRDDTSVEKMATLRNAFERSERGTLTAGNSTPLTDGAASVLLASEKWAKAHGLPVLAWLTHQKTAAVDYVAGEGLLIAPAIAVSEMLKDAKLEFDDFSHFEIHEAFAAQVLSTLKAWESESYCRDRLGRKEPLGSIDRTRLNINGSSLAVGHPFAATGARILATLAKILHQSNGGRGLISVCTAGGMGLSAVVEAP